MNDKEILEILNKYEANSAHPQLPVIWESAEGHTVKARDREYIDFTSGIFVANAGHSTVNKYVIEQAKKGLIYSYTYPTEARAKFIKKLMEITPDYLEKVAIANTGGEAVEIAVKLLRLAQIKRSQYRGKVIVSIRGNMHGKTFIGEKLKGTAKWVKGKIGDDYNEFFNITKFPDKDSNFMDDISELLNTTHTNHIAGIILESYRGWDARFMPTRYVKDVEKFSNNYDIPIVFDEIQGGFWRTGRLFSYQHYDIQPDLIVVGKGLGGGIPISAVLGKAYLLDSAEDLTSTFAGNTLCCASALGNLEELDKIDKIDLLNRSTILAVGLKKIAYNYPLIKKVRCKGFLGAIIFKDVGGATELCRLAEKRGLLLVYTGKSSVKLGPPLTTPTSVLVQALNIIEECLSKIY